MDVGAYVWVQDVTDPLVWVEAQVLAICSPSSSDTAAAVPTATLQLQSSGRQLDAPLSSVLLQNHANECDQNDLVTLPHLHEASILQALRLRYARDAIYTHIGEILISINPFKKLPALYTCDAVERYAPTATVSPDPHLFAIARAAYVDLARNGRNQSILISGESGAGKTEATKIMMKYFAETCGSSASLVQQDTSIERQVLQSNPILEAFGNARTVRNDNSSRFGKFIELQFAGAAAAPECPTIVGARIRTYLLEKIRVVSQAPHERNFHVFYELIAAASASPPLESIATAAAAWRLKSPSEFRILSQSGCYARRDGVDDAAQFQRTLHAMQQIGLRGDEILNVLSVVAALLHLGNVAFTQRQRAGENVHEACIAAGHEPFGTAASLLRVAPEQLAFALTKRRLTTATETLTVALDAAQAEHTRNALVMECYRLLFAWLVGKINAQIHCTSGLGGVVDCTCIGLLDIFGFEDMAVNSFEQLCINYANEALQRQFNEFVFEQEQKLYTDEGIGWTFVEFPNNCACLELFERKPIGLFSLADQECLFPQGTDRALLAKLYTAFEKKAVHFQAPASGWQRQSHFVVVHYAGKVSYAVDGFLAKNKDSFCETAATLLATSTNSLVQSLSRAETPPPPAAPTSTPTLLASSNGKAKSALAATSVGTQFKLQLNELLDLIRATAPHYVRCLKPNDSSTSSTFQSPRVLEQLRSGGVLEAVRVARAGFPVRMTHAQFLERYQRVLPFQVHTDMKHVVGQAERLQHCLARLSTLIVPAAAAMGVSLGRTRVFFRRQPYEQLEQLRVQTTSAAATMIQKTLRGFGVRHRFVALQLAVLRVQARLRGGKARALVAWMRQTRSATLVQRHARRWLATKRFTRFRWSVLTCQAHFRRRVAVCIVQRLRKQRAATRLQSFWRCHHARRRFTALARAVLAMQCAHRRRVSKQQLLTLRVESRNVSKLQQDNLKLQTELATLRMALLQMQSTYVPEPFPGVQLAVDPVVASTLQAPPPGPTAVLFQMLSTERQHTTNQPIELLSDANKAKAKPQSPLFEVDLISAHSLTLQAPQSVRPPTARPPRRGSLDQAASMTKAEFMAQTPRHRSRSSQQLAPNQQHALEAKVRQLREQLQEAARAANPEEEQELVVKRFLTTQLRTTSSHKLQRPRRAGSFELNLSQDCDNNSTTVDDQQDQEQDEAADNTDEQPTPPPPQFQRRASRGVLAPPLTACAPQNRSTWAASASSLGFEAPLSARPASQAFAKPRHFGDLTGGFHAFGDSSALSPRSSSLNSSTVAGLALGSVPRWCKDAQCKACQCKFTFLTRRHHCRSCGNSFCFEHSTRRMTMAELGYADAQRVCDDCFEWRSLEARDSHVGEAQYGRYTEVRPEDLMVMTREASSSALASVSKASRWTPNADAPEINVTFE